MHAVLCIYIELVHREGYECTYIIQELAAFTYINALLTKTKQLLLSKIQFSLDYMYLLLCTTGVLNCAHTKLCVLNYM